MSSIGHVLDSISSLKANREEKRVRREHYRDFQNAIRNQRGSNHRPLEDKRKLSEEELVELQKRIRLDIRRERTSSNLKAIIITALIAIIIGFLIYLKIFR